MININIQYSIIMFSIIYGLLFYYLLIICRDYINIDNILFRIINTITFFLFFTIIYYIGVQIVCDGYFHLYSFFIIIITGIIEYYSSKKHI